MAQTTMAGGEDARAFLQARVALFGLAMGGSSMCFVLYRIVEATLQDIWWSGLTLNLGYHVLASLGALLLYPLLRFGTPSRSIIHGAEIVGWLVMCLGYGLMTAAIPQAFEPDTLLQKILGLALLLRAVFVPSTWQRTLSLGGLVSGAMLLAVWRMFTPIDPVYVDLVSRIQETEVSGPGLTAFRVSNAAAWMTLYVGMSAAISAVTYGLRKDARQARQLGQYTLLRKIGEGGMGAVYVARHALLRRPTALKVLLPDRVAPEALGRFEREVQATARLTHPNTVTIFDYGRSADGIFYYVMELIDGVTLSRAVEVDGPLPPSRVVHLLQQTTAALAEAHGAGLIHRDLKPENILLARQGGVPDVVKVVDFGLVKELESSSSDTGLTQDNMIVGTPRYLPPETISQPRAADARSDLYALGCVAYYLLAGEPPFGGQSVLEVASQHLTAEPEPPSAKLGRPLPDGLEALIMQCLQKDPAARPTSAAALLDALDALDVEEPWTRAKAAAWWKELEPDLFAPSDGSPTTVTQALEIDLGRRGPGRRTLMPGPAE